MPITENALVPQARMSVALGPSIAPSAAPSAAEEAFGLPGAATRLTTSTPNRGYGSSYEGEPPAVAGVDQEARPGFELGTVPQATEGRNPVNAGADATLAWGDTGNGKGPYDLSGSASAPDRGVAATKALKRASGL